MKHLQNTRANKNKICFCQNLWNLVECTSGSISLLTEQHFTLPAGKQRWVAAGYIVQDEELLICGDRGGSVHIYQLNSEVNILLKE